MMDAENEPTCVVCLEPVVVAKRLFGLMPSCLHCVCFQCIQTWRRSEPRSRANKRCPMCRVVVHFYIPSQMWIVDPEEKEAVVAKYKTYMKSIPCKYHRRGTCR